MSFSSLRPSPLRLGLACVGPVPRPDKVVHASAARVGHAAGAYPLPPARDEEGRHLVAPTEERLALLLAVLPPFPSFRARSLAVRPSERDRRGDGGRDAGAQAPNALGAERDLDARLDDGGKRRGLGRLGR